MDIRAQMKAEDDARLFGVGFIAVIRREGRFEYERLDPADVTIRKNAA